MIQPTRIKRLNMKKMKRGEYLIYWMQASQRIFTNHALEYAVKTANTIDKPLVVYFGLTDKFPEANTRHFWFMLQGLKEVQRGLEERGILMVIRQESPRNGILDFSRIACGVIVDAGYTRVQRHWRHHAAVNLDCPLIQVESDVVVPVEVVSPKEEYGAYTIRPKITKHLKDYLIALDSQYLKNSSLKSSLSSFNIDDLEKVIKNLDVRDRVNRTKKWRGGTSYAFTRLRDFIENKLDCFSSYRNDPSLEYTSHMSPYLHFGQISPIDIALQVKKRRSPGEKDFLEELIVRRELSMNYVYYNHLYDQFEGIPKWCQKTLMDHQNDSRPYLYTQDELEQGNTHDPYWNAAQKQMVVEGKMHGYMRMYWGKKIIEWSPSPGQAFKTALYLNNKYELDGRDPNGFTGVAWCFGKHDRAWKERPIFGKIRIMKASGLKRKFNIDKFVDRVSKLPK
jgi:deoxyribodipyrimidine photo-lyase